MVKGLVIALVIILIVIIIAGVGGYFYLFSTKDCTSLGCFNNAMSSCSKAKYLSETEDASWQYTIQGKQASDCVINVKLLLVKTGTSDSSSLEGLDMDCSLTLGYVGSPETDLSKCSGKLKEQMQDMMIKKMHAYILSNIGEISKELEKAV